MATVDKQVDKEAVAATGDTGVVKGSPAPTITNSRGISEPAMIPAHGNGRLRLGREGDTNPNAGRPAERVRIGATNACMAEVARYGAILYALNTAIEKELGIVYALDGTVESCNVDLDRIERKVLPALRESNKTFNGLAQVGPGHRSTNVVEKDGYHDAASRAYDQSHDKLSFLEALKRELDGIP